MDCPGPARHASSRRKAQLCALLLTAVAMMFVSVPAAAQRRRRHHTNPPPAGSAAPSASAQASAEPTVAPPPPVASAEPTVAPPPPPPPPAPVAPPVVAEPALRPTAFDLQIGLRFYGRSHWYTDDLFRELRPYNVLFVPALAANVEWYPGAHFSSGPASWFGIIGAVDVTPYLNSSDVQGRSYGTSAWGFNAGLRARREIANRADVGLVVTYGMQNFSVDRGDVPAPPQGLPGFRYQYLRFGATGRVQVVPRVALTAGASYLLVLDTGEIRSANFFPRATTHGVEFGLGGAFTIVRGLEARLNLDWRRYAFSMNPMYGDRLIVAGAVDDYFSATVSIALRR